LKHHSHEDLPPQVVKFIGLVALAAIIASPFLGYGPLLIVICAAAAVWLLAKITKAGR
jgi:hypothetical protein